jgi:hypothetical protein
VWDERVHVRVVCVGSTPPPSPAAAAVQELNPGPPLTSKLGWYPLVRLSGLLNAGVLNPAPPDRIPLSPPLSAPPAPPPPAVMLLPKSAILTRRELESRRRFAGFRSPWTTRLACR